MRPRASGARLMIYDETCGALTASWRAGGLLYRALGRIDAYRGASSWTEALEWLAKAEQPSPIAEIQFWGHGNWGNAKIRGEKLDQSALEPSDPRYGALARIKERLVPGGGALWWFRTCETFGTGAGHAFARAWSSFFDCRVAGHTYVIWLAQSGLHTLRPGEAPSWPTDEGLPQPNGTVPPAKARWSMPGAPNTVSFLSGRIPDGY